MNTTYAPAPATLAVPDTNIVTETIGTLTITWMRPEPGAPTTVTVAQHDQKIPALCRRFDSDAEAWAETLRIAYHAHCGTSVEQIVADTQPTVLEQLADTVGLMGETRHLLNGIDAKCAATQAILDQLAVETADPRTIAADRRIAELQAQLPEDPAMDDLAARISADMAAQAAADWDELVAESNARQAAEQARWAAIDAARAKADNLRTQRLETGTAEYPPPRSFREIRDSLADAITADRRNRQAVAR